MGEYLGVFKTSRWALLLRGIIFLVLGMLIFNNPSQFMRAITMVVGIFLLIDGAAMLAGALAAPVRNGGLIFLAIIVLLLGLVALGSPAKTNAVLMCVIGLWLFFSSVQDLGLHLAMHASPWKFISPILSLVLGIILFTTPWVGVEFFGIWIGIMMVFSGVFSIASALTIWGSAR